MMLYEKAVPADGMHSARYTQLKDSLQKLSREKDLLTLEVDSENRRKEREALRLQLETNRRHNIQYMGIVVAIAAIFVLLVMAGKIHHWLEKKVIHYLTTQKMLKATGKGIWGKWFKKKDADLPLSNM